MESEKSKNQETEAPTSWERYRLSSQRPELKREGWASDGPFEKAALDLPDEKDGKKPAPKGVLGRFLGWLKASNKVELFIVLLSGIGIALSMYLFISQRDIGTVGLFALISTVPLLLVMFVLLRADRYAPMGARYILLAALWGAGVATMVASVINSALFADFVGTFGDMQQAESMAATFVAPVSEEIMKGSGVILILLLARSQVVSPMNGLVVAGTAGAAFAFVENIQYFLQAQAEGTAVLGATIVGRLVLSPFIHPMATSFIGYFYASAIVRAKGGWAWTWRIAVGFALAMATHSLWNGLASTGSTTWLLLYLLIELPLFTGWMIWISTRGSKQLKLIRSGLSSYVTTGWISLPEERMVTDPPARKYARKWARKVGKPARVAMRKYLQTAGRLGLDQTNMETSGPDSRRVDLARQSLSALAEYRETYMRLGEVYAATAKSRA